MRRLVAALALVGGVAAADVSAPPRAAQVRAALFVPFDSDGSPAWLPLGCVTDRGWLGDRACAAAIASGAPIRVGRGQRVALGAPLEVTWGTGERSSGFRAAPGPRGPWAVLPADAPGPLPVTGGARDQVAPEALLARVAVAARLPANVARRRLHAHRLGRLDLDHDNVVDEVWELALLDPDGAMVNEHTWLATLRGGRVTLLEIADRGLQLIGTVDLDHDLAPELWLRGGSGAYLVRWVPKQNVLAVVGTIAWGD